LDLWLEYVDTEKVLPLFEQEAREYTIPQLKNIDWKALPAAYGCIAQNHDFRALQQIVSTDELESLLAWLLKRRQYTTILRIYDCFSTQKEIDELQIPRNEVITILAEFLTRAPFALTRLFQSELWAEYCDDLADLLIVLIPEILRAIIISSTSMGQFAVPAFRQALAEAKQLGIQVFAELTEFVALTARSPDVALEFLLECMEPEAMRLLIGQPTANQRCVKSLIGLAVDHVEEAAEVEVPATMLLDLKRAPDSQGFAVVELQLRLDAPKTFILRAGDHVRLRTASKPANSPMEPTTEIDGIVERADMGSTLVRCLQDPPDYSEECSWQLLHCGSFVTCKSMIDALMTLHTDKDLCCQPYQTLVGLPLIDARELAVASTLEKNDQLNNSQNRAVAAAMVSSVSLLWGPPGTGKTRTVVEILELFLMTTEKRILLAAPTHNAVDNVLRKFVEVGGIDRLGIKPVRVSTDVSTSISTM
jgi:hypothetical protein